MQPNLFSLEGKTAVLTGGSGDLGIAMAETLTKAGASVVLASIDTQELEKAKLYLVKTTKNVLTVTMDVTDQKQVKRLAKKTVDQFGSLDILITAAGIQIRKPALEFTQEDWQKVLNVNLTGSFLCAQEAAKYMIAQKSGKIIFISSLTAEIGIPNMIAYVASRGGIKQMSKALAVEWAPYGVQVNCIGPGRFYTRMTKDVFDDPKTRESFLRLIPMNRPGVPSDLAGTVLFLASPASDYITGQSIYVDGGWLAGGGSPLK